MPASTLLVWIATCLIWSTVWLFIKLGVRDVAPATFAVYRMSAALLMLVPIALAQRLSLPKRSQDGFLIAGTGIVLLGVNYALLNWGIQFISSGLAAVLQAMTPVFGFVFAHFLLGDEKMTTWKGMALALGVAGVAVIFWDQLEIGGARAGRGSAAVVASAACVAIAYVMIRRHGATLNPTVITAGQLLFATGPLAIYSTAVEGNPFTMHWSRTALLSGVYLALLGSVTGVWLNYWLLKRIGATKLLSMGLIEPLIAVLLGVVFLHENMALKTILGGLGMLAIMHVVPWPHLELSAAELLVLLAALPPVFLLMIAIHESGHLIAGALARFRPCLLIVGPLKLERTMAGWRPGVNRSFPLYGGLAAATPKGVDRLRQRMTALVAGGPSASVLTGLIALVVLAAANIPRDSKLSGGATILFLLAFAFGIGSLAIGLAALVPGRGHGFASDGARLLRFLRNTPEVDGEVALLGLVGASMAGQRPRDWDPDVVALALRLEPNTSYGTAARMLALSHALDCHDIPRARELLHTALAHRDALPEMSVPALLLQAAYFEAVHEHDRVAARRYLTSAGRGVLVAPHARPLAEAAVLLAEGSDREAATALAAAAREIPHSSDKGGAVMAAELIARMQRAIEERST